MTEWARPTRGQVLLGLAFAALVVAWPLVADWTVAHLGVRGLAATLFGVGAVSLRAVRGAVPAEFSYGRSDSGVWFALVALGLVTGQRVFLLLLPAAVYVAIARIFEASARRNDSVVERVAFLIEPHAPDFIRPYCRRVTRFWAAVFLANAAVIAALAVYAPIQWWRAYTGWIAWLVFAVLLGVEFVVRKAHFRNYDDKPVDLLFERFFPSDRTEMGRRAMAYKAQMRRSLGRPERER